MDREIPALGVLGVIVFHPIPAVSSAALLTLAGVNVSHHLSHRTTRKSKS